MNNKDFGWAIEQLKSGKSVSRLIWNNNSQNKLFVFLMFPVNGDKYDVDACFCISLLGNRKCQPGWNPTQEDMLAEDWGIFNI